MMNKINRHKIMLNHVNPVCFSTIMSGVLCAEFRLNWFGKRPFQFPTVGGNCCGKRGSIFPIDGTSVSGFNPRQQSLIDRWRSGPTVQGRTCR